MTNQEKKHKKQIEAQLSELGTTAEKRQYLVTQKKLAQERIRNKMAKAEKKFEKMNAELGIERTKKTSFKWGFDEKILKRIKRKIASLDAGEDDGEQAAKGGMGRRQIKSGDRLSYR